MSTIAEQLDQTGATRRDFLLFCGKLMVAAPFGLAITSAMTPEAVAQIVGAARRPSVIWLHMQDCTGCTETLLRTSQPDLATLLFDVISLDYHETVMAASGHDAELALSDAMAANDGKYILVVEGSIPTKDAGIYLRIAGRKGTELLQDVASHAAAVVAIGSCSSWGGIPSAGPNPTGAVSVDALIKDKPVVNLPGCPPNPYILLATVLEYAATGKLPALDAFNRPKFAFDRVIHDHCPRRPHFDSGRFAKEFGDDGHRQGWCLYRLGCKGPVTHASCSTRHFNEVVDAWPIGIGHPCFGCAEKSVGYSLPLFSLAPINKATPPAMYPSVETSRGIVEGAAAGTAGLIGGILLGAGYVAARKLDSTPQDPPADAGRRVVSVSRRELFRTIGTASAVAISGSASASAVRRAPEDALGLLYDTTVCIGCKACVAACTAANGLEPDTEMSGGIWQMPIDLNPQTKNIIQLYRSPDGAESSFMKRQCMQCVDPACASACPFSALSKGKFGIVEWEPSRCIGCRFCEISCPFDVPRFEWAKFNPKIVKCELCRHRLPDGLQPACTEVCPVGAVIFGKRDDLLREANRRIDASPGKYYQDRVYGEHDLGGTQVAYLSHVPFAKLGLPEVGNESRAHYGEKVHGVLYRGMVVPTVVYAGLAFLMRRRFQVHEEEAEHSRHEDQL